jgi:hypothetical protein
MISDSDFRYLGFDDRQICLLQAESDDMRHVVYEEGLRLMMETGPGYSDLTTII